MMDVVAAPTKGWLFFTDGTRLWRGGMAHNNLLHVSTYAVEKEDGGKEEMENGG